MKDIKYVILGAGGHAKVVLEAFPWELSSVGMLDDDPRKEGYTYLGVPVIGPMSMLREFVGKKFIIAIGSVGHVTKRRELWQLALGAGLEPMGWLNSAGSLISKTAVLGPGTFVGPGAILGAGVEIGYNVIINSRALVEHDCTVGNHTHVASGAILCGGVQVGEGAHIGAGSVVLQGLSIGDGAVLGAGAVLLSSVPAGEVYVGIPALSARKLEVFL